jgi:uncharacterized protein YjbI with pentapeptide repeats
MMWRVHRAFIVGGYTADRDRLPGIVKDQVMPPVERKKLRRKVERPPGARIVWPKWMGLRGKTLWDWLLLISALAVPVVVGFAGLWLTQEQEARQQDIEDQRSQDTAMQAYLDNMSTLLIDEQGTQLRKLDPDEEVLNLIQARTETVFAVLDTKRQVSIVRYLARAQLIKGNNPAISLERLDLEGINLTEVDLSDTSFEAADFSHAQFSAANLERANFRNADLSGATLQSADLSSASLQDANLSYAALQNADLSSAESTVNLQDAPLWVLKKLGTNLTDANLSHAALQNADLSSAYLRGADLTDADLTDAKGWNREQLRAARSLKGATMPDGRTLKSDTMLHQPTYEEWLKDKEGRGENRENRGSS